MNKLIATSLFLSILFVLAIMMPNVVQAQYSLGLCTYHSFQRCVGNNLYWFDSCGNQQDLSQYCQNSCYNNSCQNYNNYCTYHASQRCMGNNLYWYDSCGNQQDLAQYCSNGCYNNICQNYNNYNYNYNYNNNCTYHAYKLCSGNNLYWYDSCGNQQDFYYNCTGGQTCQYGQCVFSAQQYIPPQNNYIAPQNNYIVHYKTACYGDSRYWYDSLGVVSGLYKSCKDNNSCTLDACSGNKCSNTLKCDGSTCAISSADYNTYCSSAQTNTNTTPPITNQNTCGNGLCEPNSGETIANCPNDCKINTNIATNSLLIAFFTKQDSTSTQWQKSAEAKSNGQIYFMITATNNSSAQIDNVNVSANIPNEISSLGNLQLNAVPVSGDIVSGINIGSLSPSSTKSITFEGKTGSIASASIKQATTAINASGVTSQSDSVSISLNPNQATASVSSTQSTSGFWEFIKRWYLWILVGLVLIFLFVVVFRRLSNNS